MSKATEYKTVQAPLIRYAKQVGWTYVPRSEAAALRQSCFCRTFRTCPTWLAG